MSRKGRRKIQKKALTAKIRELENKITQISISPPIRTYEDYFRKKFPDEKKMNKCPGQVVKGAATYNSYICCHRSCKDCCSEIIPFNAVDAETGLPVHRCNVRVDAANAISVLKDICIRSNCSTCQIGGICRPLFAVRPRHWITHLDFDNPVPYEGVADD